jgi:hypothetical protein
VGTVTINHLAEEQHLLPTLQAWFESEWPAYYGVGGIGNAQRDLLAYANRGSVPVGLVAFRQGEPCRFAALKREAFPSHPHLLPWAGAAYVKPSMRRQVSGARCCWHSSRKRAHSGTLASTAPPAHQRRSWSAAVGTCWSMCNTRAKGLASMRKAL